MSTVNFGFVITETIKRSKRTLFGATDTIADVDNLNFSNKTLAKGGSFQVTPKSLFAISTNNINILIHITVDSTTLTLPLTSWLCLPFSGDDTVLITVENPSNNEVSIPAVINYVVI